MSGNTPICGEHSGCLKDIENLKAADQNQWTSIGKNRDRIDSILTRINVILGGVVVACILLVVNVIVSVGRP